MRRTALFLVAAVSLAAAPPAASGQVTPAYDLILRNGRVVDGTGRPWYRGDVAIREGVISAVGPTIEGTARREIDVAGQEAHYIDLPGPNQHILGVIAERGGRTWFYKVTGTDPLVAKQKGAFEAFVRSIRFDENPR